MIHVAIFLLVVTSITAFFWASVCISSWLWTFPEEKEPLAPLKKLSEVLWSYTTHSFRQPIYTRAGDLLNANIADYGVNLLWDVDRCFTAHSVLRAETSDGIRWFVTDGVRVVQMTQLGIDPTGSTATKLIGYKR